MSEQGHNSIAGERLNSIIERHERLDEEIKALRDDQKDIMTEAKSAGFDVKVIKAILARRKKAASEVEELEAMIAVYEKALGEFASTPLGGAAIRSLNNG